MSSIVIGSDHAGFTLKKELLEALGQYGYEAVDVGTHDAQPVDYPDVAKELVLAFLKAEFTGEERHVRRLNKVRELEKKFGVPEGGAS
jgi:ribose 5-phosphate isomerase RpiB